MAARMKSNKRQARHEGVAALDWYSAAVRPRLPDLTGLKASGGVDIQVVHGFVNCTAIGAITGLRKNRQDVVPRIRLRSLALLSRVAGW